MTELLIFVGWVLLVAGALEVTHRRNTTPWHPGRDTRNDRDLARLSDDLRAASHCRPA